MKTDKNFRLSKTAKRRITLTKGNNDIVALVKRMQIAAQVAETNADRTVTALRCSDGSSMWAGY